jgi:hypothetical protein
MRAEWAEKGHGAVASAFEMRLGGAGQRGKRGGRCGRVGVVAGEGGEGAGPGMVVGSAGQPAMAPDHRAWAAPLPREQGRVAGVCDTGDEVSVADGRDRGKAGPGGCGRGVREKERE